MCQASQAGCQPHSATDKKYKDSDRPLPGAPTLKQTARRKIGPITHCAQLGPNHIGRNAAHACRRIEPAIRPRHDPAGITDCFSGALQSIRDDFRMLDEVGRRVDASATRYWNGDLAWWGKWDRVISQREMQKLVHDDPFGLYRLYRATAVFVPTVVTGNPWYAYAQQ